MVLLPASVGMLSSTSHLEELKFCPKENVIGDPTWYL